MGLLTSDDTGATHSLTAARYLFAQYRHTVVLLCNGQVAANAGQIGQQMKFKDAQQDLPTSTESLRVAGGWNSRWMRKRRPLKRGAARSTLGKQPWPDKKLVPAYLHKVPELRCRERVRPGSLPNFAKEAKAQESSVHFLEQEQELPEGQLEGLSFKQITNGA